MGVQRREAGDDAEGNPVVLDEEIEGGALVRRHCSELSRKAHVHPENQRLVHLERCAGHRCSTPKY